MQKIFNMAKAPYLLVMGKASILHLMASLNTKDSHIFLKQALDSGKTKYAPDDGGYTPYQVAAACGNLEACKIILTKYPSEAVVLLDGPGHPEEGVYPSDLAFHFGHREVAARLREIEATFDRADDYSPAGM